MGKYRDRTISINGRMFFIQYFDGKDSLLIWGLAIAFAFMVWSQLVIAFHFPDDKDFVSDRYREEAYKAAEKLLIEAEIRDWNNRGFVERAKAARSMSVSGINLKSYKDIAELTKYSRNGMFEVHAGVKVSLSATSNDEKTTLHNKNLISKECIITIQSKPKRHWYGTVNLGWSIVDIRLLKTSDSEEKIVKIVKDWKVPPDKKPDW